MKLGAETILQINLVNWFVHEYPQYADDLYHFANERHCTVQQGRILKRMGVRSGVADLFLSVPREAYHGAWIELKEGNGKPSKAQQDFLARMTVRGYMAVCVTGLDAAKAAIQTYLETDVCE